jgi:hypothetical protein
MSTKRVLSTIALAAVSAALGAIGAVVVIAHQKKPDPSAQARADFEYCREWSRILNNNDQAAMGMPGYAFGIQACMTDRNRGSK